ncbi:C-type lectin domain family 14 member A [Poeciliopsis prolifica]|uniref:C-type lectin domain family 14 member A n=1 Tax=Poeciliopsis prolifica TaxID=188132 RepID=UPI002414686A|nr:C-type lectin domain family 14 member A [Poeciliopsis prolifica]
MEFRLCCWWSSLWMVVFLLSNVSTAVSSHTEYSVSSSKASFDQAVVNCHPGVLPSVASQQELQEIFQLLNKSKSFQENVTVWVGLRKPKHECSTDGQPLRGFKWVENGSQEASAINWLEEPKLTCTGMLCGALRQQRVQSELTWGLIPTSCKTHYHFICKGSDAHTELQLKTSPTTSKPDSATFHPNILTSEPESCERSKDPKHPSIRSLMADSNDGNKVLVECWSAVKLDLFCSGFPAVWRVLDGSPANFSIICLKCEEGFQKNGSGFCVDVDECSTGKPCQHTCQNTEGSYRCVCADEQDCDQVAPATSDKSLLHILIPVLTVVAVLLLILVIVGVVKCCLKRRKKMKTKP